MQVNRFLVIESERNLYTTIQNCIDNHCLNRKEQPQNKEYIVEPIESSLIAFERLKSLFGEINFNPIDHTLVFVDLSLDDCDGLSLIEKLRNDYHGLKIVAFLPESSISTGALENLELRNQAESAGANAVLIAPFNLHEIVASVSRLTEESAAPLATVKPTTVERSRTAV